MPNPNMPVLKSTYNHFLQTDLSRYRGEWIAIYDSSVVSHGKNLKEVVKIAKEKYPNNKFLLVKVPTEDTMIF
jgi:hypothetical protein